MHPLSQCTCALEQCCFGNNHRVHSLGQIYAYCVCLGLCLAQADDFRFAWCVVRMALPLPLASVFTLGLMKSTCFLQVYCWTRLTHGLSSLELWLLCMHWALQALLYWGLASFSTTMIDDCLCKGAAKAVQSIFFPSVQQYDQ